MNNLKGNKAGIGLGEVLNLVIPNENEEKTLPSVEEI